MVDAKVRTFIAWFSTLICKGMKGRETDVEYSFEVKNR